MNKISMTIHNLIVIFCFLLGVLEAKRFVFAEDNHASDYGNWLHSSVPCLGDRIRFDDSQPVSVFMDHTFEVESITLPQNGLIIFPDYGVQLGGIAKWQCPKKVNGGEDVFFSPNQSYPSFYDPASWEVDDKDSFLHMNLVPAEIDEVVFTSISAIQVYIDRPVTVNSFIYYDREKMTTENFNRLLKTIEGQMTFKFPPQWTHESDAGGLQRQLADNPIIVKNEEIVKNFEGTVSSNSKNETLHQICNYVKCAQPSIPKCIAQFTPFGHCCPVCGAKIEIAAHHLDYETAKLRTLAVLSKLDMIKGNLFSIERTSNDDLTPTYQITIATKDEAEFREDDYVKATHEVMQDLVKSMIGQNGKSILKMERFWSKTDRNIKFVSKVIGYAIYLTILVAIVAGFVSKNYSPRIPSPISFSPVVAWHRLNNEDAGKQDSEIVMEMNEPVASENENEAVEEPSSKHGDIHTTVTEVNDSEEDIPLIQF